MLLTLHYQHPLDERLYLLHIFTVHSLSASIAQLSMGDHMCCRSRFAAELVEAVHGSGWVYRSGQPPAGPWPRRARVNRLPPPVALPRRRQGKVGRAPRPDAGRGPGQACQLVGPVGRRGGPLRVVAGVIVINDAEGAAEGAAPRDQDAGGEDKGRHIAIGHRLAQRRAHGDVQGGGGGHEGGGAAGTVAEQRRWEAALSEQGRS